jgi:chromosome segregation ATPase
MAQVKTSAAAALQKEIHATQRRREELAGQVREAQAALDAARAGLIAGTGNIETTTLAQARYTTLEELDQALAGKLEDLDREHREALAAEERAARLQECAGYCERANQALAEMAEIHGEIDEALAPLVARYVEAQGAQSQARRAFIRAMRALAPAIVDFTPRNLTNEEWKAREAQLEAAMAELEQTGADPAGVFVKFTPEMGGTPYDTGWSPAPRKYPGALYTAINEEIHRITREGNK